MNWGKGITIVLAIFIVGILFLVYKTTQVDFELVAEDYYAKELAYQEQIDKMKNVKALGKDIEVKTVAGRVELQFPIEKAQEVITGKVTFFRPSDSRLDIEFPIDFDDSGLMQISTADMLKGIYNIQIEWKVGETEMYSEESVYL